MPAIGAGLGDASRAGAVSWPPRGQRASSPGRGQRGRGSAAYRCARSAMPSIWRRVIGTPKPSIGERGVARRCPIGRARARSAVSVRHRAAQDDRPARRRTRAASTPGTTGRTPRGPRLEHRARSAPGRGRRATIALSTSSTRARSGSSTLTVEPAVRVGGHDVPDRQCLVFGQDHRRRSGPSCPSRRSCTSRARPKPSWASHGQTADGGASMVEAAGVRHRRLGHEVVPGQRQLAFDRRDAPSREPAPPGHQRDEGDRRPRPRRR